MRKIKITGIGLVDKPEGLRVAYRYCKLDDNGNITESDVRGSYVDDSDETAEFFAKLKADALAHVQ